jgi:hypothetical protein
MRRNGSLRPPPAPGEAPPFSFARYFAFREMCTMKLSHFRGSLHFGLNPSDVRRILRASCATTLALVPQFHRWSVALRFLRAHFTTTVPVSFGWTEQKYV